MNFTNTEFETADIQYILLLSVNSKIHTKTYLFLRAAF